MKDKGKIIEEISKINNQSHLSVYMDQNIPRELLSDKEFVQSLNVANPKVQNVLEIYYGIEEEKIIEQIEEKGLKNAIEDDESIISGIPRKYREQLYDLAKEYEKEEDFDKAKTLYEKLIKFGNHAVARFSSRFNIEQSSIKETIYYKSKCSYYACKMKNGEPLTKEDEEELNKLAKEDKNNILNLRKPGEMSTYEKYIACFDDINLEILENEILPTISNKGNGKPKRMVGLPPVDREYSEELSPDKRFEHIKEKYNIKAVKAGGGKYAGTFIFEIEDSDVVIVERFYDTQGRGKNKTIVPSYSQATYIVHKDADIDLERESHNVLVEKKRNEKDNKVNPLIDSCNHRGTGYYERLDSKFVAVEENGRKRKKETIIDTPEEGIVEEGKLSQETISVKKGEAIVENDNVSDEMVLVKKEGKDKELSEYTLEELIEEKIKLNSELEEFKEEKNKFDLQIAALKSQIEDLKVEVAEKFRNLTPELKSIIEKEVKTLKEAREKLEKIKEMRERILEAEKENKNRAEKLEEQFDKLLGGE